MTIHNEYDSECFFIAPIGDEGSDIRRRSDGILDFIVEPAASDLGLKAIRADRLGKPGQITLQVIDHILGAKAAVADLTGQNANVYYELAVRHTARLPVVLIAEEGEKLPFDIAQMRTVFLRYTDLHSAAACRKELSTQLKQAAEGNFDSPIATSVDIRNLQSGNSVERGVADVLSAVESLSVGVKEMETRIMGLTWELEHQTDPEALDYAYRALREAMRSAEAHKEEDFVQAVSRAMEPIEWLVTTRRGRRFTGRQRRADPAAPGVPPLPRVDPPAVAIPAALEGGKTK